MLALIAGDDERAWIAGRGDAVPWDSVVFSAKESLYKAIAPRVGRFVEFHEATLALDGETLRVVGEVAGVPGARLTLRHGRRGPWLVTSAALALP